MCVLSWIASEAVTQHRPAGCPARIGGVRYGGPYRDVMSRRAWARIRRMGFARYVLLGYGLGAALPLVLWLIIRAQGVALNVGIPFIAMPILLLVIGGHNHWVCHVNRRFHDFGERF